MALVVPEGFLFRKDLTKTREYLLDHCQLQSIISLPQGVFLPYTGVKTDIIYATKVNQKVKSSEKKKTFWYFDVKSDGYTLDNHRRKLDFPSDLSKYEEYCTAWKIGQIEPERYKDAIVFARSYNGREKDFKIEDPNSIFVYSLMPEKDIAKLFKIIELDNSQISMVGDLVDTRNDMAHASGKFEILNEESYDAKVSTIISSMDFIHRCMVRLIRKWYGQVLISFCKGEYEGYDNPKDVIIEQMIQTFKLSTNELLVCNETSVSSLITTHRGYEAKLKAFKKAVTAYCQEMGYI